MLSFTKFLRTIALFPSRVNLTFNCERRAASIFHSRGAYGHACSAILRPLILIYNHNVKAIFVLFLRCLEDRETIITSFLATLSNYSIISTLSEMLRLSGFLYFVFYLHFDIFYVQLSMSVHLRV